MSVSTALCNHYCMLVKFINYRTNFNIFHLSRSLCSSYSEAYVDNLLLEKGMEQEDKLTKYFNNLHTETLYRETLPKMFVENNPCDVKLSHKIGVQELASFIEEATDTKMVPNKKLKFLLVYFTKDGNIKGVKAIQSIIQKHNVSHFKTYAEYNHYLAEAFWLNGKVPNSLHLFSIAYDNTVVRPKVKIMLPSLFPSLIAQHSEVTLHKVISNIEQFSEQKKDDLILACLWKELFLSEWFYDQEEASKLLLNNKRLLKCIQWMVPAMGKILLKSHRVEDFYRLIQLTLENKFKPMTDVLIRHLFEYYYIHQNIERCTEVVKYSSSVGSPLTEDQQRRYVGLLLRSKDAIGSKSIILKKPQDLKYKF